MQISTNQSYPNLAQSWGIVGIAILAMIVFLPVNLLLGLFAEKEFTFLVYYLLAMGAAFLFAHHNRHKATGVRTYGVNLSSPKAIVLTCVTMIAMQTALITPLVSLVPVPDALLEIFRELGNRGGVFAFMAVVVAAPVLEELIFRGIVLDGLLNRYSPSKAIVMSSVMFGVLHLNPWQFISAFFIGLLAGWAYYKTRSLALPILVHFTNNAVAFAASHFVKPEEMIDKTLPEAYGGVVPFMLVMCLAWIVGGFCLYQLQSALRVKEAVGEG